MVSIAGGAFAVACIILASGAYSRTYSRSFEADDFWKCKLLKYGYPCFFLVYFLVITLVPVLYGIQKDDGGCATAQLPFEVDIIAGVAIFIGMAMDFSLAVVMDAKSKDSDKAEYIPLIPTYERLKKLNADSWVVLLFTGLLAKVDTYTDIAFIVIAKSCGSALWIPATVVLCIAIFVSQCGPMCLGGMVALVRTSYTSCCSVQFPFQSTITNEPQLVQDSHRMTDLLLAPCVCLLCVRVACRGFGFFLQEVSGIFIVAAHWWRRRPR